MKKLVMMLLVLVAVGGTTEVSAQGWLKKLGKKVENAAKNAVERNAERKTEKAVDDLFDGKVGKGNKNNNGNNNADEVYDNGNGDATAQSGQQKGQSLETTYAKSDFVPGDEIIFEDNLAGEQLGEFPSQWDLINGNLEVAKLNGENVIAFPVGNPRIRPYMKDLTNYLPDVYTIEFDVYLDSNKAGMQWCGSHQLFVRDAKGNALIELKIFGAYDWRREGDDSVEPEASVKNSSDKWMDGKLKITGVQPGWAHIALSVNKRAVKAYLNGVRFCNVPNYRGGGTYCTFETSNHTNDKSTLWIRNVRIAKGAVPLYDRMMSDGKFITYGITFDVGKSTIKPESMGEINRIVQLMTENPDLKFSVEGHTDSTGNAASNQTLSEARSQAIVAKLVELGIASDRLTAVGKGQNSPIADNNTDEGRAKNRRVEFVKM